MPREARLIREQLARRAFARAPSAETAASQSADKAYDAAGSSRHFASAIFSPLRSFFIPVSPT